MGIKVYKDTKVYVAAPAAFATGGPELLHQLVYNLRRHLNIDAHMFYYPPGHPNPVHHAYMKYGNPYVTNVFDVESNILIVPEVVSAVSLLNNYTRIRKAIWWLSVDNFYASKMLSRRGKYLLYLARAAMNKFSDMLLKYPIFDQGDYTAKVMKQYPLRDDPDVSQAHYHLVQSHYAQRHLLEKGVRGEIYYLSDYLNETFLGAKADIGSKEDMAAFNPLKGLKFTRKIMKSAPHIRFVPIRNMTREEVVRLLQKAKVYIDFGNHPGKDRIPREAAVLGCCVITGRRGAARLEEDVGIPEEYKFEATTQNIPAVISKIEDCFANFEERYKDFDSYRDTIRKEPERFLRDLVNTFETGQ